MASLNCTNTDISGVGVRSATYAQNLLSFVPAVVALLNDGKISNNEREFIKDQSTNILLTAFGLLLSAIIQAKTAQGLDNYHLALVLNLSWMNNTNTFIYLILFLHRKMWTSPPDKWSWCDIFRHIFSQSSEVKTTDKSAPEEPERLLDMAVWIGSLHLSLMGAIGIWLWSNPAGFGSSRSCPPGATISVFFHAFPMGLHPLHVFSLIVYFAVLIPIANLVLPTGLILVPYFLCPLGKWDKTHREQVAVRCVTLGLAMLFTINVIFIVDTELSILRNESRQAGQDKLWTLGQTLALLLLVLRIPIKSLLQYLLTTTSFALPFMGETAWGRAVEGFLKYDDKVLWSEVYRWRWIIRDTPIKVDSRWLLRALVEHQSDIVHFLDENGADWGTVMVQAAEQGRWEIVRSLVERGVYVDSKGYYRKTPLHVAAEQGHLDIVSFLAEHGANINFDDYNRETPLHLAAEHGHLGIVSFLVEHGADINSRDGHWETPLHVAAEHGHSDVVSFLVEHGADINSRDYGGETPLHLAAEHGHLDIVSFLAEHSVDVNSKDIEVNTPLHLAAEHGHSGIVSFLAEHGVNINSEDYNRETPLHLAAEHGHLGIVSFLVKHGANINSRTYYGKTPLHLAVEHGHSGIVSFLVKHGANINSRDHDGKTPLDLATKHGPSDIVSLLRGN